jgi:hypothetical protein
MIDYKLEHIFSYRGALANPPEMIGSVPEGIRVNFYSSGGEITGPGLRGKIPPVGGDWVTMRRDGVAFLDVRATFETHDGALILVTHQGLADFGEDGHDKFLRGELPPVVQIRTSTGCTAWESVNIVRRQRSALRRIRSYRSTAITSWSRIEGTVRVR